MSHLDNKKITIADGYKTVNLKWENSKKMESSQACPLLHVKITPFLCGFKKNRILLHIIYRQRKSYKE